MTKSKCVNCGKTIVVIATKEKRKVRVNPAIVMSSSASDIVVNDKGVALRGVGAKGRIPHWAGCRG